MANTRKVKLRRGVIGTYLYGDDWEIQNPHQMYDPDPDRKWYIVNTSTHETVFGPFDTLREVREYIAEEPEFED